MKNDYLGGLRPKLDGMNDQKLAQITNPRVLRFIAEASELCQPEKIFV
ncbi:MAG: hypothetical protein QHH14_09025 [Clostridiales bacterium]|nr:hypothetical protein [Clostridiales bacterium]